MPRPTLPRYLAKVPCHGGTLKVHLATPPWTLGRREGPPPTTIPWTFAAKVGGVGGTMVPSKFKSLAGAGGARKRGASALFELSLGAALRDTRGTLRARRSPANGRRRSPAIIRTSSAQGTFQRSTLPPHLGPSAGEKVPPYHHTLDFRRQGRWGGGDLEGPTLARYLGKVPWQGGTWPFDLAFTTTLKRIPS